MCQFLGASRSGYYAWIQRPVSERAVSHQRLLVKIREIHTVSRQCYGSPRVHAVLMGKGNSASVSTIARLMRRAGIASKVSRKYVLTTQSKQVMPPPAPNRLNQNFSCEQPNRRWVSDVTAIATRKGWLYLATVMELYSRLIVGWSMGRRNTTELVKAALTMAIGRRQPDSGLLVHSDQGVQYTASQYQKLLQQHAMVCSMSRTGNCYDNAAMESFYHTLKSELVMFEDYRTIEQAKQSLFDYIEVFYNRQRIHSTLGYLTPYDYDKAVSVT